MKSNLYDLISSWFTVHSLKDASLLALEKAYKNGQFPLSPPFQGGEFRGIFS